MLARVFVLVLGLLMPIAGAISPVAAAPVARERDTSSPPALIKRFSSTGATSGSSSSSGSNEDQLHSWRRGPEDDPEAALDPLEAQMHSWKARDEEVHGNEGGQGHPWKKMAKRFQPSGAVADRKEDEGSGQDFMHSWKRDDTSGNEGGQGHPWRG